MTTLEAIHELTAWLKLMNHDPEDSTPLEDAVIEGIDALNAVRRAEIGSGTDSTQRSEHLSGQERSAIQQTDKLESAALTAQPAPDNPRQAEMRAKLDAMTPDERTKAVMAMSSTEKAILNWGDSYGPPVEDSPHPETVTPMEQLGKLLQEAGATIKIGLRAQGKFEKVKEMYLAGESWEAIGKAIGWAPDAAQEWYYLELDAELAALKAQPAPEAKDVEKAFVKAYEQGYALRFMLQDSDAEFAAKTRKFSDALHDLIAVVRAESQPLQE